MIFLPPQPDIFAMLRMRSAAETPAARQMEKLPSLHWMLTLDGKPAGMFFASHNLKADLRALLPRTHLYWDKSLLFEIVPALMQVDQSLVHVQGGRFVAVSGSSPADWTTRSILWFDTNPLKPLCVYSYVQTDAGSNRKERGPVEIDVYTTNAAEEGLPEAFVDSLAGSVRSLGEEREMRASVHFADKTQPLHF